jgi:hypothetical protein
MQQIERNNAMNRIFYSPAQRRRRRRASNFIPPFSTSQAQIYISAAHKKHAAGEKRADSIFLQHVCSSKPIFLILFAGTGGFFSSPFYRSYARFLYSLFGGRRHLGPFDYVGSAAGSSGSPFFQSLGSARSASDVSNANP